MKIEIEYKDGKMKVEGTPTEEEKRLYDDLKTTAGKFYEATRNLLERTILEGVLEIRVKKGD